MAEGHPEVKAERQRDGDAAVSDELGKRLGRMCRDLFVQLDAQMDVRLVRTLAAVLCAIVRQPGVGLLLSVLGEVLAGGQHAPAGTKRLANLLHSKKWQADAILSFLTKRTMEFVGTTAETTGRRVLCILDGSILEKPESAKVEGLSPVNSSAAARLKRPRPKLGKGYYSGPPTGPIVVPGFQWYGALFTSWAPPTERRAYIAAPWFVYGKPEPAAPDTPAANNATVAEGLPRLTHPAALDQFVRSVTSGIAPEQLLIVGDRGLSGAPFLSSLMDNGHSFVVRWKKGNKLRPAGAPTLANPGATEQDQKADGVIAWKLTRRTRAWGTRELPDPRHPKDTVIFSFAAIPVFLLHRSEPLWLVYARRTTSHPRRKAQVEPFRLLTNIPVETEEQAWEIVIAYHARWQVEQHIRFAKNELGIETIRVRKWATFAKFLAIAALAFAFIVDLVGDCTGAIVHTVLRWAHRTGKQAYAQWRPLYRLRRALANLWNTHPPSLPRAPGVI